MSRKPLADVAKSGVLLVRVTPDERAELDQAALLAGAPTSTWLRDLGLSAARAEAATELPEAATELPKAAAKQRSSTKRSSS